jgi:carbon-monoxide dehydrogenase small subunit
MRVTFKVNGASATVEAPPLRRLLDVLRQGLTGPKEGCGEGECGACAVLVDGELANACLIPICQVAGTEVVTIEGIGRGEALAPVQKAMLECGGAQCGICTPGMIIAGQAWLDGKAAPETEAREAIAGNLCRCTGYQKIVDALEKAKRAQEAGR